jgi:hypothetical protein
VTKVPAVIRTWSQAVLIPTRPSPYKCAQQLTETHNILTRPYHYQINVPFTTISTTISTTILPPLPSSLPLPPPNNPNINNQDQRARPSERQRCRRPGQTRIHHHKQNIHSRNPNVGRRAPRIPLVGFEEGVVRDPEDQGHEDSGSKEGPQNLMRMAETLSQVSI